MVEFLAYKMRSDAGFNPQQPTVPHVKEIITSDDYAEYCRQSPKDRRNNRMLKRAQNKFVKRYLKGHGITGRVKTHDPLHRSMEVWVVAHF